MTEETTQTVATTTDTPVTPAAEAPGARDDGDLETLLKEFEAPIAAKPPEPQPKPVTDSPDVAKRLETLERTLADERLQKELSPVIKNVRGDIPEDVMSDDEVMHWIDGRAKRDERLQKAWHNRASNPTAWAKIQKSLGQELANKFKKLPDPQATGDREAVTAAVRGAHKQAPEGKPPEIGKMSNGELRKHMKDTLGYTPNF